ncbi:MAG: DUF4336 domain-containing protein [Alphaproteobacteria bacterium]|nr:DUF4336 domain-containing protein [Alphaproteobacteria bacterium]
MKDAAYQPLNTLKPVDANIWIVDGPTCAWGYPPWGKLTFPTRMTVIRLGSGDLFLHSPTKLDPSLKSEIDALGPVRHLVSPNMIHNLHIEAWGAAYPEAVKWASPGVRVRVDYAFDRDLGEEPDPAWSADVDQRIVHGSRVMEEVVFFHRPSRTLILADLIENFDLARVPDWYQRLLVRLAGVAAPDGKCPVDFRLTFWGRHDRLVPAIRWMIDCAPERVIISHGDWFRQNGVAVLRRAFRWVKGV